MKVDCLLLYPALYFEHAQCIGNTSQRLALMVFTGQDRTSMPCAGEPDVEDTRDHRHVSVMEEMIE